MPLYEYECTQCHRRVEKIQSFSADPLVTCGSCGGPLEKLISAPAIQFKGSGWYVTDYAKKSGAVPGGRNDGKDGGKSENGDSAPASESKGNESKSGDTRSGDSKSSDGKSGSSSDAGSGSSGEAAAKPAATPSAAKAAAKATAKSEN